MFSPDRTSWCRSICAGALMTLALNGPAAAQMPLHMPYASDNGGSAGGQVFFDLVVNSTISLRALDVNLGSVPGTHGRIEVYVTNPGTTTYAGNTDSPANWSLHAGGDVVAQGVDVPSPVCLDDYVVLLPGNYGIALRHVGVSASYTNGTLTNSIGSVPEMTLQAGAAQNAPWSGLFMPRVFNGSLIFVAGAATGTPTCASVTSYGQACYPPTPGSFYEHTAVANTFDLSGQTLRMARNAAGGYDVTSAALSSFYSPTAADLGLADDELSAPIPLPAPFTYPGGSTTAIVVHSNGQVFLDDGGASDFSPSAAEFLARGACLSPSWQDLDPSAGGSIHVDVDASSLVAFVTWNGVPGWGQSQPWTMQVRLGLDGSANPGEVEFRYQSLDNDAGASLVGFTPRAGAGDPGGVDISAMVPFSTVLEQDPLSLSVNPLPVQGANVTWTTGNVPPGTVLVAQTLSLGKRDPFLPIPGASGCGQGIDLGLANTTLAFPPAPVQRSLSIPTGPSWTDVELFAQSFALLPGVNALGVTTSNAVETRIGMPHQPYVSASYGNTPVIVELGPSSMTTAVLNGAVTVTPEGEANGVVNVDLGLAGTAVVSMSSSTAVVTFGGTTVDYDVQGGSPMHCRVNGIVTHMDVLTQSYVADLNAFGPGTTSWSELSKCSVAMMAVLSTPEMAQNIKAARSASPGIDGPSWWCKVVWSGAAGAVAAVLGALCGGVGGGVCAGSLTATATVPIIGAVVCWKVVAFCGAVTGSTFAGVYGAGTTHMWG